MKKKGSITVFLALVLSVLLSLVATSIQSVQAAAARTQILNGLDIGLYSLFGQYDRSLLKDFFWTGRRVELSWIWQLSMTIWNPI